MPQDSCSKQGSSPCDSSPCGGVGGRNLRLLGWMFFPLSCSLRDLWHGMRQGRRCKGYPEVLFLHLRALRNNNFFSNMCYGPHFKQRNNLPRKWGARKPHGPIFLSFARLVLSFMPRRKTLLRLISLLVSFWISGCSRTQVPALQSGHVIYQQRLSEAGPRRFSRAGSCSCSLPAAGRSKTVTAKRKIAL